MIFTQINIVITFLVLGCMSYFPTLTEYFTYSHLLFLTLYWNAAQKLKIQWTTSTRKDTYVDEETHIRLWGYTLSLSTTPHHLSLSLLTTNAPTADYNIQPTTTSASVKYRDVSLSLCIILRKRVLRIRYLQRKYDGVHTIIVLPSWGFVGAVPTTRAVGTTPGRAGCHLSGLCGTDLAVVNTDPRVGGTYARWNQPNWNYLQCKPHEKSASRICIAQAADRGDRRRC
jgi:hypothetical protein